jgi:hypothetical protein
MKKKSPTLFPPPHAQLLLPYNQPSLYTSWDGSEICTQNPKSAVQTTTNCMLHSPSLISCAVSLDTATICPSIIKLPVTTLCGKKVVQHCCVGMRGLGGELPVTIALDLVLVLWVFEIGAEMLVLAVKGLGSWWVMRAPEV